MPASRQYDAHQVAKIILEALDLGLPITSTVQQVLGVERPRANYMIRGVRLAGLMSYREHEPARAVIHRNTLNQQAWLVCQHCKTPWPCAPFVTNRGTDTDEPRERGA